MSVDPLPVRRRQAARVLVLDGEDRLLLIHDSDQGQLGRPAFWITPGGGLDPGEDWAQAALRELKEETGLSIEAAALLGPVWHRQRVDHTFSDHRAEQEEVFFVARVEHFDPTSNGLTPEEKRTVLGSRWWTAQELAVTEQDVWPRELPALLPGVIAAVRTGGPLALAELPDHIEDPGGGP